MTTTIIDLTATYTVIIGQLNKRTQRTLRQTDLIAFVFQPRPHYSTRPARYETPTKAADYLWAKATQVARDNPQRHLWVSISQQ